MVAQVIGKRCILMQNVNMEGAIVERYNTRMVGLQLYIREDFVELSHTDYDMSY